MVQRQICYFSDWIKIMSQPQNHWLAPQWRETAQATTQTSPVQHSLGVECPRSRQVWWKAFSRVASWMSKSAFTATLSSWEESLESPPMTTTSPFRGSPSTSCGLTCKKQTAMQLRSPVQCHHLSSLAQDYKLPSKHARSNLEAFWLWLIVAITASMQPKSGQTVYAGPNFPHQIPFHSSKEGVYHIVQNQPGSDLDGLVRFWPNAPGLEASQCARSIRPVSDRMQAAHYQFPTFSLSCILQQMAQTIFSITRTRKVLCGSFLCAICKFSFIHSFITSTDPIWF